MIYIQHLIKIHCNMNSIFEGSIFSRWISAGCFLGPFPCSMRGLRGKPLNRSCRWAVKHFVQAVLMFLKKNACWTEPPLYSKLSLRYCTTSGWVSQILWPDSPSNTVSWHLCNNSYACMIWTANLLYAYEFY